MKKRCAGFTLLELLASMLIIVVISSLVLGIYTYVNAKANRTRAQAEIAMLGTAISAYSTDFGGPPQTDATDALVLTMTAVQNYDPTSGFYKDASKDLYKALTGDENLNLIAEAGEPKAYIKELDVKKIVKRKDNVGDAEYLRDPYSYSYGYSTAALKAEQDFKEDVRVRGRAATRPDQPVGFNSSGYDLWSTAGNKRKPADVRAQTLVWMEWVKNW